MEESKKHAGLIVELAKSSKFLRSRAKENGHDCWGNYEWTTEHFISFYGEEMHVSDRTYVIHDGEKVIAVCYDEWWLKRELEKIVAKREQEEKIEKARAELAETEKKFKALSYPEQLKFRIEGIKKKHPKLEKIFEKVREVCSKDARDYDNDIERTFEMYDEVAKILET
jgi:hypothetical protein